MARLKSMSEFLNVAIQATPALTKQLLVETAKREHGRILAASGRPVPFTRTVDGTKGAPEEAVRPFGFIQYDYHRLEEVIEYALQVLFDFSPVLKDEYRRAHTLIVNDVEARNLADWKPGDEVQILNPLPYARKIERGAMKMRVPGTDHVYQRAALAVNRRFGNIARTRFTYRSAILPYVQGGRNRDERAALRDQPARRSAMALERETRVPALSFEEYL